MAFYDAISISPRSALRIAERVSAMIVAVIGCGGLGTGVAFMLASLGVGRLWLIDGDRVELSNLNRQFLFTRESVGRKKAVELRQALRARFEETKITAVPHDLPSRQVTRTLTRASHIICVADHPPDLFLRLDSYLRPNQEVWSAGYVMGVSVTRFHSRRQHRQRSQALWQATTHYFAPSIAFQNMEIAASLVARIVLGRKSPAVHTHDYRR